MKSAAIITARKKDKQMNKANDKIQLIITVILCALLFSVKITGSAIHAIFGVFLVIVMVHPLKELVILKIIHCLSSVILCLGILWHVIQHKGIRKEQSQNVS